ncbi:39S ribosomal protein L2, mitochondrial [Chionoecetes opilio]|uniref:39S ribosomal protein L2, mitochondrial n=1 Tax=Chionoecetes opilio TaxID=41210 RepID=A0A8J4XVS6_CHIOP|nr:39S ribosomal protein L2, mitochondrial [Chionoecetes opilio]
MASVRGVALLGRRLGCLTLGASPAWPLHAPAPSLQPALLVRSFNIYHIDRPKPSDKKNFRYTVHYPEDGQYTVKPLKTNKLGGRDPETGRLIVGTLGGGAKRNYRWIDWFRTGPTDGTFLDERVINVQYDPNRSARIALVATGDNLRYLLASDNMKKGDLIRTSGYIPRIPVRPKEGDAYPVGALPQGTQVHCVEIVPGDGARMVKAAGTSGLVMRKIGKKVVVQLPSKRELALDPKCMATVGRLSNPTHGQQHVGSAQRRRWLGRRPASGLWQRKDGYRGRKIKPLPPRAGPRTKDVTYSQFIATKPRKKSSKHRGVLSKL